MMIKYLTGASNPEIDEHTPKTANIIQQLIAPKNNIYFLPILSIKYPESTADSIKIFY